MTARSRLTSMSCNNFSRSLTEVAGKPAWPFKVSKALLPFWIEDPSVDGIWGFIWFWTTTRAPPAPVFSLHSRQLRTAQVQTKRRHCLRIPPLDMFFSASKSAKLRLDAKIRTSAITTSLWRKEMATSMGMPWVGSSTSNSFCNSQDFFFMIDIIQCSFFRRLVETNVL